MDEFHTPVLLKEVLEYLRVEPGKRYIDATIGGGGHAVEILRRSGVVLGIDLDKEAIRNVECRIQNSEFEIGKHIFLVRGNFRDIEKIAHSHGFDRVLGILFDLGLSSYQIEKSGRGFSYLRDEPLDMRFDPSSLGSSGQVEQEQVTAADIVNTWTEEELYDLFSKMGEEHFALSIAHNIVRSRKIKPIRTSGELTRIVQGSIKKSDRANPPARVFMAIRIAVNNEITNLKVGLRSAFDLLGIHGRLVVIDFHSIEDRIVKKLFQEFEKEKQGLIVTKKPIVPSYQEIKLSKRARSAKMRVIEKL